MTQREDMDIRVRRKLAQRLYEEPAQEEVKEPEKAHKSGFWEKFTVANVLWVVAAAVLLYATDILFIAWFDERVKRLWFFCALCSIFVTVCIAVFLIVYLSYVKKVDSEEWDFHYPAAIPVATASFLIGSFCLVVALWPVYGYFTPVLLFTVFMGFVILTSWLPAF